MPSIFEAEKCEFEFQCHSGLYSEFQDNQGYTKNPWSGKTINTTIVIHHLAMDTSFLADSLKYFQCISGNKYILRNGTKKINQEREKESGHKTHNVLKREEWGRRVSGYKPDYSLH